MAVDVQGRCVSYDAVAHTSIYPSCSVIVNVDSGPASRANHRLFSPSIIAGITKSLLFKNKADLGRNTYRIACARDPLYGLPCVFSLVAEATLSPQPPRPPHHTSHDIYSISTEFTPSPQRFYPNATVWTSNALSCGRRHRSFGTTRSCE